MGFLFEVKLLVCLAAFNRGIWVENDTLSGEFINSDSFQKGAQSFTMFYTKNTMLP